MSSEIFIKFFKTYLNHLVEDREEYFIAITNLEKKVVEKILEKNFLDSQLVWADKRDYAQAVAYRNDVKIKRIVILSCDSIKQIDSLKDFIEYPILSNDDAQVIKCLEETFEVNFDKNCIKIIKFILEMVQVSIEDLFDFITKSIEFGVADFRKMYQNLYIFGIWQSERKKDVTKQHLKLLKKNSDLFQVRKRLLEGIEHPELKLSSKKRKRIMVLLSKNKEMEIFKEIPFEKVECLFQVRNRNNSSLEIQDEEMQYENSYENLLIEDLNVEIEELEEQQEIICLSKAMEKYEYIEWESIKSYFYEARNIIENIVLLKDGRSILIEKINTLEKECKNVFETGKRYKLDEAKKYTPVLLYSYTESQKSFIEQYFSLLGFCMSDEHIIKACTGSGLIQHLQNMFCEKKDGEIVMPFYHPVAGVYYLKLRETYERQLRFRKQHRHELTKKLIEGFLEKKKMQFPIQYLFWKNELYQLDHTSLRQMTGKFVFKILQENGTGSWINIRVLSDELIEYINRNCFQSEVNMTIVDINDISDIMFLFNRLYKSLDYSKHMIKKVVLNIVSRKENELKNQLKEKLESNSEGTQVLFRFTQQLYYDGNAYDVDAMIKDSDILFLADSSLLYQKPRQISVTKNVEWYRLQFSMTNLSLILKEMKNDFLEILWDSLHCMDMDEDIKIVRWNTREFKPQILGKIRNAVQQNPLLTAIIVTSNREFLKRVYYMNNFQARKYDLSDTELFSVKFYKNSNRKTLRLGGKSCVSLSLECLLRSVINTENIMDFKFDGGEDLKSVFLTFHFNNGQSGLLCELFISKEEETVDEERDERGRQYHELMMLLIEFALENDLFRENILNCLYEQADSFESALFVDWLGRNLSKYINFEYRENRNEENENFERFNSHIDCAEALEFQDMLQFIRQLNIIDPISAKLFSDTFEVSMLEKCLKANRMDCLLEEETFAKLGSMLKFLKNNKKGNH